MGFLFRAIAVAVIAVAVAAVKAVQAHNAWADQFPPRKK